MKKSVLTYGVISGSILAGFMTLSIALVHNGALDSEKSEIVGYTAMLLAFVLAFLGIRSYRETAGNGTVTFGKAFQVGILITLISCAFYVVTWEIIFHNFVPDFADKYAAHSIEKLRASGASDAAIVAATVKMAEFKKLYANPFFNVAITFLEVFPIGLIVTLVSSAILRRKTPPRAAGRRVTAPL